MKSKTRLDSAVFQLTPTRTRYTLVINANGETEKVCSGLLDPFLAHLKAAQDQIARGCYSILLQPNHVHDAVWFTKATVERFVRFVNTPEVLERVNMTESEISQIKEAIAIQNSDVLVSNNVEYYKQKVVSYKERYLESPEGIQPLLNVDPENSVIVYNLGAHHIDSNGSTGRDSSKVQFMRVLETRKTVLQKEQVMAFTRAIAAGYDMDRMVNLVSFAECFGAQRLMEACLGFMVLWKEKHECDELFETEAMPSQSDSSSMNNYKTMIPEAKAPGKTKEVLSGFSGNYCKEGNGQTSNAANADLIFDQNRDKRSSCHHEVCPPLQGVPFHQNHLGGGPFFQQPYSQMEEAQFSNIKSMATQRNFMGSKEEQTESELWESKISCMRPQDDSALEKQSSQCQEQSKKAGRNSGNKSGTILIRNINYISSERRHSRTNGVSQYSPDNENDKDAEDVKDDGQENKKKKSVSYTKGKESHKRPIATENPHVKAASYAAHEADTGNWQVFQNILLRQNDENKHVADLAMFAQEKEVQAKRQNRAGGASDELVSCRRELSRGSTDCLVSRGGGYGKAVNDGFVIYGQKTRSDYHISKLDSFAEGDFATANKTLYRNSLFNVTEESFLPMCSSTQDQVEFDFRDIDAELQSGLQKEKMTCKTRNQLSYEPDEMSFIPTDRAVRQSVGYDPFVDYNVNMNKRIQEDSITGSKEFSKKLDKDVKARVVHDNAVKRKQSKASKLTPLSEAQEESRPERLKSSKADLQKMKKNKDEEELKRLEALKRERQKRIAARSSSGLAQLTASSQMRPQQKPKLSLTLYKGSNTNNLGPGPLSPPQSLPKRTASSGSGASLKITKPSLNKVVPSQSTLSSQASPQVQRKLSPLAYKGSKFSDAEPGPSSPLQRLRRRAASLGSNASEKFTRPSGSNSSNQYATKKSIQSVSSLPELKKYAAEARPDMKVPAVRIRTLSDPTISNRDHVCLTKLGTTGSEEPKMGAAGVYRVSQSEASNRTHSSSLQNPFLLTSQEATDQSRVQNIPIIVSKGRSKAAAPLEKKHQMVEHSVYMVQNRKSELTLKKNGRSSIIPETRQLQQGNIKSSQNGTGEDKQVIETTVVLENEMPLIPNIQVSVSGERIETRKESDNEQEVGDRTGLVTEQVAIQTPASPVPMNEVEGPSPTECHFGEKEFSHKVTADYAVKEIPKSSSIDISPKANQVPCAWVSSQEDACTTELEYIRVTPRSPETAPKDVDSTKAHASSFTDLSSSDKTPGSIFRPRVKEFSKGIRRILRFGRSTEKQNAESDGWMKGSLVDNCVASTASSNGTSGKKVEQKGLRRETMSHALYIA